MEIVIVGGGVSGLTTAVNLARKGMEVTILERNNKCGKKLLLTGNGRCNFWNSKVTIDCYNVSDKTLFQKLFDSKKDLVLEFIKSIGIIPKEVNGYYYPYSNQAISVYNALVRTIQNLNVKVKIDTMVSKIEKKDKFILTTNKGIVVADKVIIATGGKTYTKTGSDGNGYNLVKRLGHKINYPLPALTKLKSDMKIYKDLKGVRSDVILTLIENNKKVKQEQGELMFTEDGISGICTFNLSGIVSRGLKENKQEKILINFMPWFKGNIKDLIKWLDTQAKTLNNYSLSEILEGFLNYKIVNVILKMLKIDNCKWDNVSKEEVAKLLISFPFIPKETGNFEEAQVTTGGVPLEEINIKTMESLKIKGLYLIGEILDVDGICGGYNIGFAIMSGLTVGSDLNA